MDHTQENDKIATRIQAIENPPTFTLYDKLEESDIGVLSENMTIEKEYLQESENSKNQNDENIQRVTF